MTWQPELEELAVDSEAEQTATIRHGVRAMAAINQTDVPWCSFIWYSFFMFKLESYPFLADFFKARYH